MCFHLHKVLRIGKLIETENSGGRSQGLGGGGIEELVFTGVRIPT